MDDLVLDKEGSTLDPTVDIKDMGPCTKSITITIPSEAVDMRLDASFHALASDAHLPGFRKGKVPRAMLERRFGDSVRQETRGKIISEAYTHAIESSGLNVVGDPEFEEGLMELELKAGSGITFTVEVEVLPDFELPDLEGVPVVKPELEITQEHLDQEIIRARYRLGNAVSIDGPFEWLDRMIGHGIVRLNDSDEIFYEHQQVLAVVPGEDDDGKGQFLGLLIEGLDKILMGKKVGDTIEFETTGPDAHEREELRGATVKVTYSINKAERVTPLEVDELVELSGVDNVAGLEETMRLSLENRRDTEQRTAEREQVHEWLLENIKFDTPPRMTEGQVARAIESQRLELATRGLDNDEIEAHLAEMRTKGDTAIQDRLRIFFILGRLAQHFEIQVTESEVNRKIADLAASRNERPEQVRAELAKNNQIRGMGIQIQQEKSVDRIVDTAKVTTMSAEDWNALVDAKAAGIAPKTASTTPKKKASSTTKKTAAASKKKTAKKRKGKSKKEE